MQQIINEIKGKDSFSEVSVTEFAPAGKWADRIAVYLGEEMKATQLRKVFTTIKQMDLKLKLKGRMDTEDFNDDMLYMMVPHLAYAKARKYIKSDFYDLIKTIIGNGENGKIKKVKDFRRFVEFMTAIVAFHKYHNSN